MQIRFDVSPLPVDGRITGAVVIGDDAAACRHAVVHLVRHESVDGRVVTTSKKPIWTGPAAGVDEIPPVIAVAADTAGEPPTYHGRRLRIEHSLEARVELADGRVVEARETVVLSASPLATASPEAEASPWRMGRLVGLALIASAVALVIASRAAFEATLAAAVNVLIGVALLMPDLWRRRWGQLRVNVTPRAVPPGAPLVVRAEVRPRRDWTMRGADISLEAEEVVEVPEPDGHSVERERVVSVRTPILEDRQVLKGGESLTLDATLTVPTEAPPTLRCASGRLEWQVCVRLRGDHSSREEACSLVVLPPPGPHPIGRAQEVETSVRHGHE